MLLEQFRLFIHECSAKGFTHVKTAAGDLPLKEWHPYGAFGGNNPGIEKHIGGIAWIAHNKAKDYPPPGVDLEFASCGVWTFEPDRCQ